MPFLQFLFSACPFPFVQVLFSCIAISSVFFFSRLNVCYWGILQCHFIYNELVFIFLTERNLSLSFAEMMYYIKFLSFYV